MTWRQSASLSFLCCKALYRSFTSKHVLFLPVFKWVLFLWPNIIDLVVSASEMKNPVYPLYVLPSEMLLTSGARAPMWFLPEHATVLQDLNWVWRGEIDRVLETDACTSDLCLKVLCRVSGRGFFCQSTRCGEGQQAWRLPSCCMPSPGVLGQMCCHCLYKV